VTRRPMRGTHPATALAAVAGIVKEALHPG
jgi:hypothetical protein